MNTLIFTGSPRENGNSAYCANFIKEHTNGNTLIISAHKENIAMCIDCGYCKTNGICRINDNMRQILKSIHDTERIVIISPLYFSTLTPALLALFSRTQVLYNSGANVSHKKGLLILIGGGSSKNTEGARLTGRVILRQLGCADIEYSSYVNTDAAPVWESEEFKNELLKDLGALPHTH